MPVYTPVDHEPDFGHPDELLTDSPGDVPSKEKAWGIHLIVDMSSANNKIDSEEEIKKFFHTLIVEKLKMKELSPVMFERVNDRKDGHGISAAQMLTTSHLCLHADDDHNKVFLDVFSCRFFEKEPVLRFIHETFQPKKMAYREIIRDAGNGEQ